MRADRLVSIILILEGRGRTTCADLARELEVSRRTILRDIGALSYAGIPVQAEGGKGGGVFLDEAYRSGLTGLGEEELKALLIGADPALAADLGWEEALRAAKLKLEASRSPGGGAALAILQRRLLVDSRWWWREEGADAFLEALREAVFADEAVEAEYERYDGTGSSGRLEPYGLVAKAGFWYLIGRRGLELRCYRVSRFRSVRPTGERFVRDGGFDVRDWWPKNEERFAGEFSSYRFIVAVSESGLLFLRRIVPGRVEAIGPCAAVPGWTQVEVGLDSALNAELVILGLGLECRVLEPRSLAQAAVERARLCIQAHGI